MRAVLVNRRSPFAYRATPPKPLNDEANADHERGTHRPRDDNKVPVGIGTVLFEMTRDTIDQEDSSSDCPREKERASPRPRAPQTERSEDSRCAGGELKPGVGIRGRATPDCEGTGPLQDGECAEASKTLDSPTGVLGSLRLPEDTVRERRLTVISEHGECWASPWT